MKDDLLLEDASFEMMPEIADELAAMAGETGVVATPPAVNRNSSAYIRWVQESLNRILGLRLATDGRMGPQTRSAIRSFQKKQGLAADGIVGVATEAALLRAVATQPSSTLITIPPGDEIKSAAARLDRFDFDKSDLKPQHRSEITQVAARIAESWRLGRPFFTVYAVGHTDSEGPYQHNMALGFRRSLAVRRELTEALKRQGGNLAYKVLILAQSNGPSELIEKSRTTEWQALNRRVELFLSTRQLQPKKPSALPTTKQPSAPEICIKPEALTFFVELGTKTDSQALKITNCSSGALSWEAINYYPTKLSNHAGVIAQSKLANTVDVNIDTSRFKPNSRIHSEITFTSRDPGVKPKKGIRRYNHCG